VEDEYAIARVTTDMTIRNMTPRSEKANMALGTCFIEYCQSIVC
jgi:hypothetical protein